MRQSILRCFALAVMLAPFGVSAHGQQSTHGDRNKLTRVELDEGGSTIVTAREAVRLLRPQWLAPPRGRIASSDMVGSGGGGQTVILYIDDIRQPDLEALSLVPGSKIFEMRYLDQNRAVMLRGPGHEAGVIEITTTDKRK